jgi:SAM-dependent methyltransferase
VYGAREGIWVRSDLHTNATLKSVARAFVPKSLRPPVRKLWWTLANGRATYVDGLALPSRELRASMCGQPYDDDLFFVNSVSTHARKLVNAVALTSQSRIVDVGCGLGRLALGLIRGGHQVEYLGLDSQDRYIWWCKKYIQRRHPNFQFKHINVENERYNPNGEKIAENFRLPISDGHADVVHLWGVLTNMNPEHMRIYVSEVSRILRKGGSVFLTAFAEKKVPVCSINPADYISYRCVGPLHVVRYEDSYLRSVFSSNSLRVKAFAHQTVDEKQSEFHLEKQ